MIQWSMQEKAVLVQARRDMLRIIFKGTKNTADSTLALQQKNYNAILLLSLAYCTLF